MTTRQMCACLCMLLLVPAAGWSQEIPVPNGSFLEGGEQTIAHWELIQGTGGPDAADPGDGTRSALLHGNPEQTSYWRSEPLPLEPRALYAMQYMAKRTGEGGGPPVAGPAFSNYILYSLDPGQWTRHTLVFQTPDDISAERSWLRLGQARMSPESTVSFDDVRVYPVQPVYARLGDLELGAGESIAGNRYESAPMWNILFNNQDRSLYSYRDTVYNYNAFLMGDGSEVVMRYRVGDRRQLSGTLGLRPLYLFDGALIVEAGTDGARWEEVCRMTGRDGVRIELPESLFPAEEVWVRFRCEAEKPSGIDFSLGSTGLSTFNYEAEVDGEPVHLKGETRFVEILGQDPGLEVTVASTGDLVPYGDNTYVLEARNREDAVRAVTARIRVEHENGETREAERTIVLPPSGGAHITLPYEMTTSGAYVLMVTLDGEGGFAARSRAYASPLYTTGYGEELPAPPGPARLWRASSGWKVARNIPVPGAKAGGLRVALARNEAEAVQLVVRPDETLRGFIAEAGALAGPGGAVLPEGAVEVLRVRYVDVTMMTDRIGAVAPWPEPLPPFREPVTLDAGMNHPLWVRVTTPKELSPGVYRGEVKLTADGYEATVPLEVEVFDFTLPDAATLETAFGLAEGMISQYHRVEREVDRRRVWEEYLKAMAAYRLSPYNPAPFDPIQVAWPDPDDPEAPMEAKVDAADWVREMRRVFETYHFKTFRLPIHGLTGRKYPDHRREIAGFGGDTAEFLALFNSYAGQIENLLREQGWLDKGFVYWFDEPTDEDIAFVQSGFTLLKDAAPDLRRMIALNKSRHLEALEGYINLWCPQIDAALIPFMEKRRAAGDRFWWYVCTIPREPYPGLFIDHPGVNMRAWPWMTWGHEVSGILVWAAVRWHSPAVYPDALQNPYEDPMTWQGDAGPGVRHAYGNGDGLFLYPPERIFEETEGPVFDAPVGSIRGEMLRDGIEDYEYFATLRGLLDEKGGALEADKRAELEALLDPPDDVYTDRRTYSHDPGPIERHRERLARAIMVLRAM